MSPALSLRQSRERRDTRSGEVVAEVRLADSDALDRRIRAGWEEWCDLLEGLVGSGGMLPSRKLARRAAAFFEDAYWLAEEARMEALRRDLDAEAFRRRRGLGRARGRGIA